MTPEISLLIAALIALVFSFLYFIKGNFKPAIFLLIVSGLSLRIFVSLDPFLHVWDECFHAVVAKHLIAHPLLPTLYDQPLLKYDYQKWFYSYVWLHKPPLPAWAMALSMKWFGVNEFALRIPSILLSTTAIWITYFIGKTLFNNKVGWIAAFFQTINGFVIEITGGRIATDHIDVFFFFFIELAVLFAIMQMKTRKSLFIIPFVISLVCAIYSKWLPALIVIPVWWVLNDRVENRKSLAMQLVLILFLGSLMVLPWQWYIYHNFPELSKWESHFNWLHLTTVIEERDQPWYYFFANAIMIWNEAIWLAVLWCAYQAYKNIKRKEFLILLVWIFIPYLFFSMVKTKMLGYVLFTAPAMFLMLGYFMNDLHQYGNRHSRYRLPVRCVELLIVIVAFRYSIERIKPFKQNDNEIRITQCIKNLNNLYPNQHIVFFNNAYSMQIMFYTPYFSYDRIPTEEDINTLLSKGYQVKIFDNNYLPESLRHTKNVEVIGSCFE